MASMAMINPLDILDLGSFGSMPSIAGVSPSNSSADDFDLFEHDEDAGGEDDFGHPGIAFGASQAVSSNGAGSPTYGGQDSGEGEDGSNKKRPRRQPSTAAKRATHNAVERARRESLNGRFTYLATQLPMQDVKRASKNAIVEKAIEFIASATHRENQLTTENASLLAELNTLRARLGMPARAAVELTAAPSVGLSRKKAKAAAPLPVSTPVVAAPVPVPTGRSVSPHSVTPTPTTATMPMSMAPLQPVPAQTVIQQAAAANTPANIAASFIPGYDWHMNAASQYAAMDPMNAFNPFAMFDPSAFGAFNPAMTQQTPAPQIATADPSAGLPMNAAANANSIHGPAFWAQYARQVAMPYATPAH